MSGSPPKMAPATLGLRFGLEIAAGVGVVALGNELIGSPAGWIALVLAVGAWGIFNVPDDPSRSGKAPVVVSGWVRLIIELVILGTGAAGLGTRWGWIIGGSMFVLIAVHYLTSRARLAWLLSQSRD